MWTPTWKTRVIFHHFYASMKMSSILFSSSTYHKTYRQTVSSSRKKRELSFPVILRLRLFLHCFFLVCSFKAPSFKMFRMNGFKSAWPCSRIYFCMHPFLNSKVVNENASRRSFELGLMSLVKSKWFCFSFAKISLMLVGRYKAEKWINTF